MKEVTETKSKTAFFNLYASDVMNSYGTETYTYNGKTYHFDGMYGWRHFVQQCNSKGIQVTGLMQKLLIMDGTQITPLPDRRWRQCLLI